MAPKRGSTNTGMTVGLNISVDPSDITKALGTVEKEIQSFAQRVGGKFQEIDTVFAQGFKGFKSFSSVVTTISENTARLGKSFEMLSSHAEKIKLSSDALSHLATGMASFNDISKAGMSNFKTLNSSASELAIGLKNLGNVKLDKAGENIKNIGSVIGKIDPASVKTFKDLAKGVNSLSAAFEKMPDAAEINAKGEAIKGMTDTTIGGLFKNIGEIRAKSLVVDEFTAKKGRGSFGGGGGGGGSDTPNPTGDGSGGPSDSDFKTGWLLKAATIGTTAVVGELLRRGEIATFFAQKEGGSAAGEFGPNRLLTARGSKADTLGTVLTDMIKSNLIMNETDQAKSLMTLTASGRNNPNLLNTSAMSEAELRANRGRLTQEGIGYARGITNLNQGLGMDMSTGNQIGGMVTKNAEVSVAQWLKVSDMLVKVGKSSGVGAEGVAALSGQMVNFAISTRQVGDSFETAAKSYMSAATGLMSKGLNAGQASAFTAGSQLGTENALMFDLMAGVGPDDKPAEANRKRAAFQKQTYGGLSAMGGKQFTPYLYNTLMPGAMKAPGLDDNVSASKFQYGEDYDKIVRRNQMAAIQPNEIFPMSPGTAGNVTMNAGTVLLNVEGANIASGIANMIPSPLPQGMNGIISQVLMGAYKEPHATGGMIGGEESGKFGDSVLTRLTPGEYVLPKGETKELIYKMADKYGLDKNLFYSQIQAESNFNPKARSKAGAMGLGQLMPATARALGVKNPYDPAQNLEGAAKHMSHLLGKYGGDYGSALAAYNEGETAFNKGKMPTETRNYVAKVMGRSNELYSSTTNAVNQAMTATRDIAVNTNRELNTTLSDLSASITTALSSSKMDSAADGLIQAAQMMLMAVQKMVSGSGGLGGNGTVEALARGMAPYASWGRG